MRQSATRLFPLNSYHALRGGRCATVCFSRRIRESSPPGKAYLDGKRYLHLQKHGGTTWPEYSTPNSSLPSS